MYFKISVTTHMTRYNQVFSFKSPGADKILSYIKYFKTEASILAKELQCDYDKKIFGSAMNLLLLLLPLVISLPMDQLSHIGKFIVHMSWPYLTENQMPRTMQYYAIKHATRMMHMIPGKYKGKLASPFKGGILKTPGDGPRYQNAQKMDVRICMESYCQGRSTGVCLLGGLGCWFVFITL